MKNSINPHYNPEELNLEQLTFEAGYCYEFDTLCFWATETGQIYSAQDSGCSCPTPFENYEEIDQKSVLQLLERVGSLEQAENIFDEWNVTYDGSSKKLNDVEKHNLTFWIKEHLKY